jgi:hypothetical protein
MYPSTASGSPKATERGSKSTSLVQVEPVPSAWARTSGRMAVNGRVVITRTPRARAAAATAAPFGSSTFSGTCTAFPRSFKTTQTEAQAGGLTSTVKTDKKRARRLPFSLG